MRCSDLGAINILRRRRRGRAHVTRPPRRGGERGGEGRVGVNNSTELLSRLFVKRCQKRLRTRACWGEGVSRETWRAGGREGGREQRIWSTRDSAQQLSSSHHFPSLTAANGGWTEFDPGPEHEPSLKPAASPAASSDCRLSTSQKVAC